MLNSKGPITELWGTPNIKIFAMQHLMMKYSYYYVIEKLLFFLLSRDRSKLRKLSELSKVGILITIE